MSEGPIPLRLVADQDDCRERRGEDRRAGSRRAPHFRLDPLFAATLVAKIAPKEQLYTQSYTRPTRVIRPGIVVNVSA
jgi:hypothetical protein